MGCASGLLGCPSVFSASAAVGLLYEERSWKFYARFIFEFTNDFNGQDKVKSHIADAREWLLDFLI